MTEKTGVNFGKVGRYSRTSSALLPLDFLFLVKKIWIISLNSVYYLGLMN